MKGSLLLDRKRPPPSGFQPTAIHKKTSNINITFSKSVIKYFNPEPSGRNDFVAPGFNLGLDALPADVQPTWGKQLGPRFVRW